MFVLAFIIILIGLGIWLSSRFIKDRTRTIPGRRYDEPETVVTETPPLRRILFWSGIGVSALGVFLLAFTLFYSQAEGTVMVQRDITGKVLGQTDDAGLHAKAPWVDPVELNVRNQPVAFGGSVEDFKQHGGAGYSFDGPYITVQDSEQVSHNVSANILYSVEKSQAQPIVKSFTDETAFKNDFVYVTIRDVIREAANELTTEEMLSDRAKYREAIMKELSKRWETRGVELSEFNLQEITSPDKVKESFENAQAAQIQIETETANKAAAKIRSEQQINEAESAATAAIARANGEAEANRLIAASLTPEVLQKLLIDAYDEGTVYVTNGSSTLLNVK